MYNYYIDDANYTEINGIIEEIDYRENFKTLFITVNYDKQKYYYFRNYHGCFKIIDKNEKILAENLFYTEINIGDEILFTSAHHQFGDGYEFPIVSISANEKIYLDFEIGKANLLKYIRN
jgi:hypothetical protein